MKVHTNPAKAGQQSQVIPVRTQATTGFVDARPQMAAQMALKEAAAGSKQARQLKTMQAMLDASPQAKQLQSIKQLQATSTPDKGTGHTSPNRTGLPNQLKSGIESLSGMSMDHVKVHYNSAQPSQLHAHAYAQGSDIHIGPGQEQHLPHEAWHVVQQAQGRVRPTMQMKENLPLNDDPTLEQEADQMGEKALSMPANNVAGPALTSQAGHTQSTTLQRRVGLELEFPIIADGQGILDETKNQAMLKGPEDAERAKLHGDANSKLDKNTTMVTGKGFVISPDHNKRVNPLVNSTPARGFAKNILEYIFKPAVETEEEMFAVLDNIFAHVSDVRAATKGFTERAPLSGNYYAGPINTNGVKPDELDDKAYSMQVNIGVETQKIPDLFALYSQSSELAETENNHDRKNAARAHFQECLVLAVHDAAAMEESIRKRVASNKETPLLGLKGIFAVMALYLRVGSGGVPLGGTIKNSTPLLLKTPISDLVTRTLSDEEKIIYTRYRQEFLADVLQRTRGEDATAEDPLVNETKRRRKSGVKVSALNPTTFHAPFIVAGQSIQADSVGPARDAKTDSSVNKTNNRRKGGIFETRMSGGQFGLNEAKLKAKEMFTRVNTLHKVRDTQLPTYGGTASFIDHSVDGKLNKYQEYLVSEVEKARVELTSTAKPKEKDRAERKEEKVNYPSLSSHSVSSSSVSSSSRSPVTESVKKDKKEGKGELVSPSSVSSPSVSSPSVSSSSRRPVTESVEKDKKEGKGKLVNPSPVSSPSVSSSSTSRVSPRKSEEVPAVFVIVSKFESLIRDDRWNSEGRGVFGKKLPSGISQLRTILNKKITWEQMLLELAQSAKKSADKEKKRPSDSATTPDRKSKRRSEPTRLLYLYMADADKIATVDELNEALNAVRRNMGK
ncbi:DUF4157 domain-containing protein [Undibacterium sp. Di26W]|uniref:eCIS core domain-containing protein n=1 Tax=Undibacterium sp. Di26W TaxID=3413035 RepID=UPI003BF44880